MGTKISAVEEEIFLEVKGKCLEGGTAANPSMDGTIELRGVWNCKNTEMTPE